MKLKIQARAKINWTLDVVGTLPNGYHDLDMLMQSVTLCDQMTMEEAPQLSLYVRAQGRAFVPADGNNLVLKAAAALQAATGCTRGARITLKKYIPVAAGMGGGSADGDQTGPHPGCTVCAVSGSRLCVFLWNGDYHAGLPEEDAGKDVQSHAGFADQVF